MLTILLIILLLALVGVLPTWPYSHAWGLLPERWIGNQASVLVHLIR